MGPLVDIGKLRALFASAAAAGNLSTFIIPDALAAARDREDVYAAYGQYQFGFGRLGIITGVRVERTQATYGGAIADASGAAEHASCPIIDPVNNPTTHVCQVSNDRTYTNFFPTAQARYEFEPDLIGRAAISSTIARPGFEQVTASTIVDIFGDTTTGNPNLKPTTATGLDLAIEKYLPHAGIASVGFFAKDIKNYIVTNVAQRPGSRLNGGTGVVSIVSFANAAPAHLYGVETNFVQHFADQLPGVLGGLGVAANWTWVDSRYNIPVADPVTGLTTLSRRSTLPSSSRNTANAEVLYDMYGLSVTLGAYYVSKDIFGLGPTTSLDTWVQERFSVDFGSQYKVSDQFGVYFNLKNLTNTALKYTEGPGENRVVQREFYGLTMQFGGSYKF